MYIELWQKKLEMLLKRLKIFFRSSLKLETNKNISQYLTNIPILK